VVLHYSQLCLSIFSPFTLSFAHNFGSKAHFS